MSFWIPLWLEMKLGFFTTLLNRSNSHCNGAIRIPLWRKAPCIWRDSGSALPFQTRLTQTKPVLPLPNEHGSQVMDQGRRSCCHTKQTKFPYRPTREVLLLSGHRCTTPYILRHGIRWTESQPGRFNSEERTTARLDALEKKELRTQLDVEIWSVGCATCSLVAIATG
jgi:hypothetical protein